MAYGKEDITKMGMDAIKGYELTTIAEVIKYLPCEMSTLYSDDEWKMEVLEPLKKAVEGVRTDIKEKMKKKWIANENNATLQIAAFKLMATDEELNILNTSKVQSEHSGVIGITWNEEKTYEADQETDHSH